MALTFHRLSGFKPVGNKSSKSVRPDAVSVPVPLRVRFSTKYCTWGLKGKHLIHKPRRAHGPIPVDLGELDAWDVRTDFLRATSPEEMLKFLNSSGVFLRDSESGNWTLDDLFDFQRAIRYLSDVKPAKWRPDAAVFKVGQVLGTIIKYQAFQIEFDWMGNTHSATIEVHNTLGAMLATVLIDHITDAEFGYCARPDCRKQYRIGTKHDRKYCSSYCAHFESVRRHRSRKKDFTHRNK